MITYNRGINMSPKQMSYVSSYNKENYKMYQFRVKKSDTELIKKLESVTNRNAYITSLIENDINPGILTIKQIKERIKPIMLKHRIEETYLFGSYARGEANKKSDVDIYCSKGDVDTLWKLSAFHDELKESLGKEVDIVTIGSEMHDYFKEQLQKDMIKIC